MSPLFPSRLPLYQCLWSRCWAGSHPPTGRWRSARCSRRSDCSPRLSCPRTPRLEEGLKVVCAIFCVFLIILAELFIFLYYKQKTVNTVISQLIQLVFIKQFGSYYPIPAGRSQEFANVWYFNPWLGLRCCECSARCWGWPWPVTPCRAYCWCLSGLNGHEAALCPVTREVGGDQIERYLPHVWPNQSTGRLTEYNQHMELN